MTAYTVRFAPSPTGVLHVGGARTAIFNWLLARQSKGKFLLRIEDTDQQRSTEASTRQIVNSLQWLGLNWDGPIVFQSQNQERHRQVAQQLLEQGKAYRCFCSREELEAKRQQFAALKINKRYDGTCRHLTPEEIQQKLEQKLPFAIRFKVPAGSVTFNDLVHGKTQINNDTLDDFIIVRSDGTPVYQLAVVVDDHDMGINLVLRGDDHLSNTNKQILLYQALGWQPPQFAHVPLILGPDKNRLSKRHGATSVEEFREQGILAEALFNYLCLLGWSAGDDREFFSKDELIRIFSIQRITRTAAVFDHPKLLWMNAKYLAQKDAKTLLQHVRPFLEAWKIDLQNVQTDARFLYLIDLQKIRSQTLKELAKGLLLYFRDPEEYEDKGVRKFFRKPGALTLLKELHHFFAQQPADFFNDIALIEQKLRQLAEKKQISAAKLIHPLRLALTGSTASPGIFELIYVLNSKKVLTRLKNAINYVEKMNDLDVKTDV